MKYIILYITYFMGFNSVFATFCDLCKGGPWHSIFAIKPFFNCQKKNLEGAVFNFRCMKWPDHFL
jgi:hypothetical protein